MRTNLNHPVYYRVNRDPEVYRQLDATNKNLARGGFFLGAVVVGGYFVVRKVRELSDRVKELEKEAKKEMR